MNIYRSESHFYVTNPKRDIFWCSDGWLLIMRVDQKKVTLRRYMNRKYSRTCIDRNLLVPTDMSDKAFYQ